jgi:hypothetical protein
MTKSKDGCFTHKVKLCEPKVSTQNGQITPKMGKVLILQG